MNNLKKSALDVFLNVNSDDISRNRRGELIKANVNEYIDNIVSSQEEMDKDWNEACCLFFLKCIDGQIVFSDLDPECYETLEAVWMTDAKKLKAYYNYTYDRRNKFTQKSQDQYFYEASNEIRNRLFNMQNNTNSYLVKNYLNEKYLTNDKFNKNKKYSRKLIGNKAYRLYQCTNNETNIPNNNWLRAEYFTKVFYDNILPAIELNSKTHIINILKMFQICKSKTNGFQIINAFEASLAIYFMSKKKLFQDILNDPKVYAYSVVSINNNEYMHRVASVNGKFNYFEDLQIMTFTGIMTSAEKLLLLSYSPDTEYKNAIESLYYQSIKQSVPECIL